MNAHGTVGPENYLDSSQFSRLKGLRRVALGKAAGDYVNPGDPVIPHRRSPGALRCLTIIDPA